MCKSKARLAGIIKSKQAERRALFGAQGLALIRYNGEKSGELPATVYTGIRYPYYPGRKFYVDANDMTRVLSWKENSAYVFEHITRGNGASGKR